MRDTQKELAAELEFKTKVIKMIDLINGSLSLYIISAVYSGAHAIYKLL